MPPADPQGDAGLAALRRRLYAPDATDDDRRRYAAAVAAQAPVPPPLSPPPPSPDPACPAPDAAREPAAPRVRPRRRAALIAAAAVVLILAVAGVAALTAPARRPASAPRPTIRAVALAVPISVQQGFARSLTHGGGVDLADYLLYHPAARPARLTTLTRAASEEHHGVGGTTVSLGPSTEADRGGDLTVILTLGARADATWRAARVALDRAQRVAAATAEQPAGLPLSTTVAYTGRAPTLLSVSVPRGTAWDAFVVFSN